MRFPWNGSSRLTVASEVQATAAHRVLDAGTGYTEEEKEHWRPLFDQFLREPEVETDEDAVKHRKQARLSIHAFICAIDNQLRVVTGRGLQAFVAPSAWEEVRAVLDQIDLQGREIPFPLLSLCVDQGSDGWGAWWYLCYGANCRTAILRDPSHRLRNDLELD